MRLKLLLLFTFSFTILLAVQAQEPVETILSADGPGGTYELLSAVLGGTPYEVPDCDHEEDFQHIDEAFDDELQKNVFRFFIHKDIDTDRCKTNIDRQRNEIKTYGPSPEYLLGNYGETVVYEWYFKIDASFQPSSRFTHLFQLKASGGNDDANPLFTITPRKSSPDRLELIYGSGNDVYQTVASTDLDEIRGEWVKVSCKATYVESNGEFEITISRLDGTEVISYSNDLDLWRTGADFVRPKWGIYRSLYNVASLRDETVLFADFKITEIPNSCPVWFEDSDGDGLGDPNFPLTSCTQPEGYVDNSDDMACRNYYEDADGDGLGDPSVVMYSCEQPEGYINNNADDDCGTYYQDLDNDGLGNPEVSVYSCEPPAGYVMNNDDEQDIIKTAVKTDESEAVYIYPVVAINFIEIKGLSNQDFLVLDLLGKTRLKGRGTTIDVSALNPGMYILQVNNQTFRFLKK